MKEINYSCLKKEAYKNIEVANMVKRKREKIISKELRVYKCGTHYHLTSMPDCVCNVKHEGECESSRI